MNTIITGVPRQTVIEAYVEYDCGKKHRAIPDFANWDWNSADALDCQLRVAGLKSGVLAGYTEWNKVTLDLADLRQCAVVSSISNGGPRDLASLETSGALEGWLPNQEVEWFANVQQGQPFPETDPFILRRATVGERPAVWYLEDGSGRGTAIVGNASLFIPLGAVAHAYLGTRVDPTSSFMQRKGFS
jgi:hypothetical protein